MALEDLKTKLENEKGFGSLNWENRLDNPGMVFSLHEDKQAYTPVISYNLKLYQNDSPNRE